MLLSSSTPTRLSSRTFWMFWIATWSGERTSSSAAIWSPTPRTRARPLCASSASLSSMTCAPSASSARVKAVHPIRARTFRGNGMCFSRNVLARMGWTAFTLAEDAELHMQLVDTGHVVHYAPETSVTSRMPTTLAGAQTQNARWERGRLLLLRRYWRPFLAASLRRRDARHLDAIAEQAIPPLSVLVGVSLLYWAVSLAIRSPGRVWAASLLLLGEAFYVGCGLRISRAPSHVYAALLSAPLYVLWKGHLYARALVARGAKTWIRTPRGDETISPDRSI